MISETVHINNSATVLLSLSRCIDKQLHAHHMPENILHFTMLCNVKEYL